MADGKGIEAEFKNGMPVPDTIVKINNWNHKSNLHILFP